LLARLAFNFAAASLAAHRLESVGDHVEIRFEKESGAAHGWRLGASNAGMCDPTR
jgi:hypothetical protein